MVLTKHVQAAIVKPGVHRKRCCAVLGGAALSGAGLPMHSYEVPSTKAGALCGETSYVVRGRMTSLCVRLTLCGDGQTRFVFFLLITIKMEQFIETVRLNPCLWKVDEKNYKSQDARDIVWEEVSKKCNITDGKEAKRVWKKLRDSFRDALKRQNECKSS
ncbi:uncharacterized protein LOC126734228 [Anthonomus grandis grandis]|uniref:uncharacterized protein LOC126734228 n=1 Tax=Anthonomus grandis grandis TaxID=2921223 RepID=UPI002165D2D7|nr:uncharacterized protein LOC126734228 [Anthonomus grandis grandis]